MYDPRGRARGFSHRSQESASSIERSPRHSTPGWNVSSHATTERPHPNLKAVSMLNCFKIRSRGANRNKHSPQTGSTWQTTRSVVFSPPMSSDENLAVINIASRPFWGSWDSVRPSTYRDAQEYDMFIEIVHPAILLMDKSSRATDTMISCRNLQKSQPS